MTESKNMIAAESGRIKPLCKKLVNRGDSRWSNFQPCGRPVEADGLCKLHLRVKTRMEQRDKAWQDQWDAERKLEKEANKLGKALGIKIDYHGKDSFVVPGEWLRRLAELKSDGARVRSKPQERER